MNEATQPPGSAAPGTTGTNAAGAQARPGATASQSGPAGRDVPEGLYKTTIVIWSRYPSDTTELSGPARPAETGGAYCSVYRSAFILAPPADPDWDGTGFFGLAEDSALLLCDGCYQAATGLLAECEDGCCQDLDHTGLCRRPGADECQWCGRQDRLHEVSHPAVEHQLPTVGEHNEGQWFLHWPDGQRGPYPSPQAAWDDWHAHPDSPHHHEVTQTPVNQHIQPPLPAGDSARAGAGPSRADSAAGALHDRRMAQAQNSPRIGQPPRNPAIADMDPDELLTAARREAVNVREAATGNGDLIRSALELAEQFTKLDEWLSDFRPLPEAWA